MCPTCGKHAVKGCFEFGELTVAEALEVTGNPLEIRGGGGVVDAVGVSFCQQPPGALCQAAVRGGQLRIEQLLIDFGGQQDFAISGPQPPGRLALDDQHAGLC